MDIKEIAGLINLYEMFLQDYSRTEKPLLLYGAGSYCDWVIRLLRRHKITPSYIVDKNAGRREKWNIPLISLDEAKKLYQETSYKILLATPMYAEEVQKELEKFIAEEDIYAFECELYYSFIHDLNEYRKFLCDREEDFLSFYRELGDELSRQTMESVLMGRISGDMAYFRSCRRPHQYYIDELFDPAMKGVFLDVGASVGDTLEALADRTNKLFEKVYCFEPSKDAYAILSEKAKEYGERVQLVNKGAWDKKEILEFWEDAEHGASKIVGEEEENTIRVQVDCLDVMVDVEDRVVHIKMDIEGAEKKALRGAKRIIQRDKPMLAICAYHRNDDFLAISKLIREMVPEYKFYLRHHNVAGTETVLYAVI